MNKILLVGRLVKDPELKHIESNGKEVCNFTIAVNRNYVNAKGEREADFVPVVVWGKTAELVCNYMKKGRLLSVSGRLQIRNYEDKEGNKKYVSEVVGEEVLFLDSKKESVG
ncbi:single-stranded DNA-binding protein [Clostridium arbusti]|uniref:single-stranded DNA-binding protein n=1 Tax=Clostridium arbusti TaxID=1137848 RepID=UPI000287F8FF|nr:single-stranded DNA-binding protein [Clostridium arbusti]